ncbi:hypothetical protein MMRN_p0380 (plasmid) [Mycobacterium marinum]|nr:hypothetical protein MMRN_p0380 [Mycobacterium marinum]
MPPEHRSTDPRGRPPWVSASPVRGGRCIPPQLAAPPTRCSHPRAIIGNLSFTAHGVYAHYLINGLPYSNPPNAAPA